MKSRVKFIVCLDQALTQLLLLLLLYNTESRDQIHSLLTQGADTAVVVVVLLYINTKSRDQIDSLVRPGPDIAVVVVVVVVFFFFD